MSVDSGPLPPPPQLSPDGKYVWDGSQWRPIAGVADATHAGIFPAWDGIKVEPSDPVDAPPQMSGPVPSPVSAQAPVPEIDYAAYAVQEPSAPITPLWQQRTSTGISKYLYVGAGIVVVVIGLILLNSMHLQLPWPSTDSTSSSQPTKPSPTPDTTRPPYERADRFLNGSLTPAVGNLEKTVPALTTHCDGPMSNICFDALNATEQQVKNVLAVVDRGDIPACIGTPMSKVVNDLKGMDSQLQVALDAFKSGSSDDLATGVYRFKTYHRFLVSDLPATKQIQNADCHKVKLPAWVP